jgi:hypothetical protein
MIFSEPGKIKLRPWTPQGAGVVQRYSELANADQTEEVLEALRLIQDKYAFLTIDDEHRPYLGDAALVHLRLPLDRGIKSTVYISVYPDHLAIISADYRDKKILDGSQFLDDLPS